MHCWAPVLWIPERAFWCPCCFLLFARKTSANVTNLIEYVLTVLTAIRNVLPISNLLSMTRPKLLCYAGSHEREPPGNPMSRHQRSHSCPRVQLPRLSQLSTNHRKCFFHAFHGELTERCLRMFCDARMGDQCLRIIPHWFC